MSADAREHPYASFLHEVQKPSRYLGGEHGEVRKDWDSIRGRMCFCFPDVYDIGMSHLGLKILYGVVNAEPDLLCERAFAPWTDMEAALRARGEPLRSLENARPLRDFDVVGMSLQFELTYSNVLCMLDLGGIALRSADRAEDAPLVVAGGPTATHAEPIAPFIDAFLIGDGEQKTPEILRAWRAWKDEGVLRAERLRRIAALGGWYVPSLYATREDAETGFHVVDRPLAPEAPLPVQRAMVELRDYPFPSGGPVSATETIFDRVSIEIARGCTEGCRFCQAGMIYRPVRERDPLEIADTLVRAVREGGYDEASLTCLSTADYSAVSPLVKNVMQRLEGQKVSLSVSSLRAYGLTEELLDEIRKVRATGLTFAPEAGTQRMRDVVNKNVTEEQLLETAERVFSRGWEKMKLYFMIGLPTEQDDDVRGIVATGARALAVGRRAQKGSSPRVTVSVSTHVPKPHTPFQWCAMDSHDEVDRKQSILRDEARKTRVQLRLHGSGGSWLEGVLARGDRSLADAIEHAYHAGARFDSWEDELRLGLWQTAFEATDVDPTKYLRTIPVTARLPWDHLDVGLEEGFLAREYRKSLKNRLSPPCGKAVGAFVHHTNVADTETDARKLVCYDCGVACDLGAMREERLVFLRKLGAHERPALSEPSERTMTPKQRRPVAQFHQGTPVRVRLRFSKLGRAAFSSHLDLVRVLPRIFRRAGLALFYSQGFHPKPEMTFAPALSLGVASLDEHVDLKLCEGAQVDPDALPAMLDAVASDGIRFLGARVLGANDASISKVIDEARYVAALPRAAFERLGLAPGDVDALAALVDWRRGGDLRVRRTIEGITKIVDVGAYLVDVRVGEGAEALAHAGYVGELWPVTIVLRITGSGTAKAGEALGVLTGDPELPARLVRESLGATRDGRTITPLDLDALRRPRPPAEPAAEPPSEPAPAPAEVP